MMHRIFLRSLLPLPLFLVAACSEPLHVGDVVPAPPAADDCSNRWAKKLGDDPNNVRVSHAVDAAGNIFLAGSFVGALDLGTGALTSAGDRDILVAGLTPDGVPVWSKQFGDDQGQHALNVATDGDGNVLVIGIARGTVDFGSGPRTAASDGEGFLLKLDPAGNHLWSKLLGSGTDTPDYLSVSADAKGGVLISGGIDRELGLNLDGTKQALPVGASFVARFDGGGALVWEKTFPDSHINAMTNRKGEVALTGTFNGTFSLGGSSSPLIAGSHERHVVAHLDAQGNEIYKLAYGEQGWYDKGVIDESGSITMVGSTSGISEFPPILGTTLLADEQTYVVRLNPFGVVTYSRVSDNRGFVSAWPDALATIEGDSAGSSLYVVGLFHHFDTSLISLHRSDETDGPIDFAGCPSGDGSSIFMVGLDPHGELTSCRRFAQRSYGPFISPTDALHTSTITAGGEGRLLLSGGFKGTTTLDCATLNAPPIQLGDPANAQVPGFLAKIAR